VFSYRACESELNLNQSSFLVAETKEIGSAPDPPSRTFQFPSFILVHRSMPIQLARRTAATATCIGRSLHAAFAESSAKDLNYHNGVRIGPVKYPPCIVPVDYSQFVTAGTYRNHRPRLRQRKILSPL
jgi:hypothetical protein